MEVNERYYAIQIIARMTVRGNTEPREVRGGGRGEEGKGEGKGRSRKGKVLEGRGGKGR